MGIFCRFPTPAVGGQSSCNEEVFLYIAPTPAVGGSLFFFALFDHKGIITDQLTSGACNRGGEIIDYYSDVHGGNCGFGSA